MPEIQTFLDNKEELKRIVALTKDTDSYYLEKRDVSKKYNPKGEYDFDSWRRYFDQQVCSIYENLHKELLYTNQPQDFDKALNTFNRMNKILQEIDE